MPPLFALLIWFLLLLALFRYDPGRDPGVSPALWVPLIWFFIVSSRPISEWLDGASPNVLVAADLEQGNPLDRNIGFLFILLAFFILASRSFEWGKFFGENAALTALLSFALLSVIWSDFPFVSIKRYFRDLGIYLMILVVLSDPRGFGAVRLLLRRLCFLLVPLSIVLNKYFPVVSKHYDDWTGEGFFSGATTSRNMLGVLCLISGLYFFWDTVTRWRDRHEQQTRLIILVNVAFFAMTLWLLSMADSATSRVCLALGCLVIAAAHSKLIKRHRILLIVLIPVAICTYLVLQFVFGIDFVATLSELVGRNPNLTGRTDIWKTVLSTETNPLIGVGYESFFLGPRLRWVWLHANMKINEAHDGYIEVYLTLGIAGLCLVAGFLAASYRNICRNFMASSSSASLGLALWTILLFYNVTESALFNGQLLWVIFLLGVVTVSKGHSSQRTWRVSAQSGVAERSSQGMAPHHLRDGGRRDVRAPPA